MNHGDSGSQLVLANRFGGVMSSAAGSGYEGAQFTGVRDGFFCFPLSGRREMDRYTRVELLRKKRALEANLPAVGRIQSAVGRKSVGHGIFPTPRTADADWNKENLKQFLNRAGNPGVWSVDASMDFFEQTRFLVEGRFGDGEGFAVFSLAASGTLQVDVRDPAECTSGSDDEAKGFIDGIQINRAGRPLAYRFETGGKGYGSGGSGQEEEEGVSIVPASAVCHLRRVRRAKSLRSVTEFFAGINSLIDVLDLKALLVGTAKLHSVLAVNVKRNKGDAGKTGITGALQKLTGDGGPSRVSENFPQAAAISYLAENEDIVLATSSHPSPNILEFVKLLVEDVARGTDIPASVVLGMMGMSGAPTRAELEDAQNFFDAEQDRVVWRFCNRAYILDTACRMNLGLIGQPKGDPEWWNCAWRGPAKLSVDAKYTMDSAIKGMKNGALTHVRYHNERAQDAYEEFEEELAYQKHVRRRCKEENVPVEAILEPTPGAAVLPPKEREKEDGQEGKEE